MPLFRDCLPRLWSASNPDLVLERVLPLVEAVARRSAYRGVADRNPRGVAPLADLVRARARGSLEQITRFPLLLDELLNEGRLFKPPLAPELAAELRERLDADSRGRPRAADGSPAPFQTGAPLCVSPRRKSPAACR